MFSFSILKVAPVADYKGWVKAWTGDGVGGAGEAVERKVLRGNREAKDGSNKAVVSWAGGVSGSFMVGSLESMRPLELQE